MSRFYSGRTANNHESCARYTLADSTCKDVVQYFYSGRIAGNHKVVPANTLADSTCKKCRSFSLAELLAAIMVVPARLIPDVRNVALLLWQNSWQT